MKRKVYLTADVYGMCGGVHSALKILQDQIKAAGQVVYVFRELVHNRSVTDNFRQQGVVFAETVSEIPFGSVLVIGAHGVDPETETALKKRAGICADATCPLVKKLHNIVNSLSGDDELIIFGKSGHPEVQGVAGHSSTSKIFLISEPEDVEKLPELHHPVFVSQTTVDHDLVIKTLEILRRRFHDLRECSGVCNASEQRQAAVIKLAGEAENILVIGSSHSSNARRLREIAERNSSKSYLIDDVSNITPEMLNCSKIGVTSGASTPQYLFDEVIAFLEKSGFENGNP